MLEVQRKKEFTYISFYSLLLHLFTLLLLRWID